MDEMSFRLAMENIKGNFDPNTDALLVSNRAGTKICVDATRSPSTYVNRNGLYKVSLDNWNKIDNTYPIVHSVDAFMNTEEYVALSITMFDGKKCFFCNDDQYAYSLDVPGKHIIQYSSDDINNLYKYENRYIIFDDNLMQTTLEVTTYEGEKYLVEYLFSTPNNQLWIAIINGKPHIIDGSGKERPYVNQNVISEDKTINKVYLPADTKGDDDTIHPTVLLYQKNKEFYGVSCFSPDDYRVHALPFYSTVIDKIPDSTYNRNFFRVVDINGLERYASGIKDIGNSSIPFVLIDEKLYAINEKGEVIPFEIKDKDGTTYLATCIVQIKRSWAFVCIENKYFPINDDLVLEVGKKYSFDINVSHLSDVFLVLDEDTGKYGYMNTRFELLSPGCVLETDEYNQPPMLQSNDCGSMPNNYPAIFRIDGKVGLNYCCYNNDRQTEIRSIVPMGKYASIRLFNDRINPFCIKKANYYVVQDWEMGSNGEKKPNESGYGILKVTYLPFTKDSLDIVYSDERIFSVKSSLIVPLVMSSRQILDMRDIWELDLNNRLPILEVLSKKSIKPRYSNLPSNELVDDRYALAHHLWIAMQKSEKVWWKDANSRESAIELLGKQLFSEKYLLSDPHVVYRAFNIVFGTEMYKEIFPLLDRAFKIERPGFAQYPRNGIVDFSEVIQFIVDKIIGGQSEPAGIGDKRLALIMKPDSKF